MSISNSSRVSRLQLFCCRDSLHDSPGCSRMSRLSQTGLGQEALPQRLAISGRPVERYIWCVSQSSDTSAQNGALSHSDLAF